MLVDYDPVIRYTVWRGPLTDPSPTTLDTTFMRKTARGIVGAGRTVDLTAGEQLDPGQTVDGLTLSFPDLRHYSVFQVTRDRGVPIVLVAAILILLGLLPALYTSRRKVWVRAEPNGDGSVLKVGGFALQRKPQFEDGVRASSWTRSCGRPVTGGRRPPRRGAREGEGGIAMTNLQWARISQDAFNVAFFSYLAAMVAYFAYLAFQRHVLWQASA